MPLVSGIAFVVKFENILASLYVTRKRSRLTSAQSSVTGLYGVRYSPLLLLTLGDTQQNDIMINLVSLITYPNPLKSLFRTFCTETTSTELSELFVYYTKY